LPEMRRDLQRIKKHLGLENDPAKPEAKVSA
jgi:hypothetical protein